MDDEHITEEEVHEEERRQEKINRSFEEDYSAEMAEAKDSWADSETEQLEVAIQEEAEEDLFLKAELDRNKKASAKQEEL